MAGGAGKYEESGGVHDGRFGIVRLVVVARRVDDVRRRAPRMPKLPDDERDDGARNASKADDAEYEIRWRG